MTNTSKGRLGRLVAAVGVVAIATLGAVTIGGPASATDGPNIDPKATGSVTIHKYQQPAQPTTLPHDGTALTPEQLKGLQPLEGVTFSIAKVDAVDLATNAGWTLAEKLTVVAGKVTDGTTTFATTAVSAGATAADGTLAFPSLGLGVYLVTETGAGGNPIAVTSPPFLVSVPLPNAGKWLYDIHVYPKNSVTGVSKSVDDSTAFGLGQEVAWTVTGDIPNLAADGQLTKYDIVDALDARLGYVSATVTAKTADGTSVPLDPADYVLTAPTAGSAGEVKVVATASGLDKLEAAAGGTVQLKIVTTVKSIEDGSIENSATLYVNDATVKADAVTYWGALKIFKYTGEKTALKGAQFQIFTSEADAIAKSDAVVVDGKATFTSPEDGMIVVPGLKAGVSGTDYWIVETQAPVGYTATAAPTKVTVKTGDIAGAQVVKVHNSQVPAYALPLTGGNGPLMFATGGGALVLVAVGAAFVIARRKAAAVRA